ncbi:hypothetical protein H2198_004820 [Neophaeococcomyces mojaviensis]|uniref:Uncharacterized protein n=1 Tax=Neophaeococcomyces mojaviensis TaxID=3383035 RepID=A0ACC3A854_9EURO|nr:hypothetical protein H2198_004820 [Knufia sp. JES_112]
MTPGILHTYHPSRNLNLFEHTPYVLDKNPTGFSQAPKQPSHILLFIGGLFDNFNLPHYVSDLSSLFPISSTQHQPWRIMHVQLSSNGRSWGIFTIDRDIEEIAVAIDFIRTKLYTNRYVDIVLMGHSTGCQDIMRYLTAPNPLTSRSPKRPSVEGAILQAPVSDRDGVIRAIHDEDAPKARKAYDAAMKIIDATAEKDRRDLILPMNLTKPLFGPAPINIERFLSLVSPESPDRPSIEDFFSHDLKDEAFSRTFGAIRRTGVLQVCESSRVKRLDNNDTGGTSSLLVLMSDSDEHVGPEVNQKELLERWRNALSKESGTHLDSLSTIILNAIHDVGGDDWPSQEARLVKLRKAVLLYMDKCVGDVSSGTWDLFEKDRQSVMKLKRDDGRDINAQVGVLKL